MSQPENEPAGVGPIEINSIEEFTRLFGEPTPEQTQKLAEQGAIAYLRHGVGIDRIQGIPWFVRVPPSED